MEFVLNILHTEEHVDWNLQRKKNAKRAIRGGDLSGGLIG